MSSPSDETIAILDQAIVDTVVARVGDLGLALEPVVVAPDRPRAAEVDADFACCIGFGGDQLSGAFCSTASQAFVRAVWPVDAAPSTEADDLADWYGELVNQVFGGVRARLVSRGFDVYQGAPLVVGGIGLHRKASPGAFTREHVFRATRAEVGHLRVLFDVFFRGAFDLTEVLSAEESQAASGHVRIF